ncbi:MAG: response regulator [Deltaproteobacteria bacterium]|nr:response regulator [Deltaproteobacteria bacterium]
MNLNLYYDIEKNDSYEPSVLDSTGCAVLVIEISTNLINVITANKIAQKFFRLQNFHGEKNHPLVSLYNFIHEKNPQVKVHFRVTDEINSEIIPIKNNIFLINTPPVPGRSGMNLDTFQNEIISELLSDYVYIANWNNTEKLHYIWILGAFSSITGFSPISLLSGKKSIIDIIHEDDRLTFLDHLNKLNLTNSSFVEYRISTKSGQILWLKDSFKIISISGKSRIIAGAVSNITSQKEAQLELMHRNEYINFITDNLPVAISHFDAEDRLSYGNSSFFSLFKEFNLENGRKLETLLPEFILRKISTSVSRAKTGFKSSFEGWFKEDKTSLYLETKFIPDKTNGGFIWLLSNKTELIKIQEYQEKLNTKIRETQRLESLGVLAGGIAHDFNNMLMGILGNAGLALMELPIGAPCNEHISHIETAALRLSELTNQLLAYSGKGKFVTTKMNINDMIREMDHLLEIGIPPNVRVRYNLLSDIPLVEGDPSQIRQIIMNIMINANESIGEKHGVISVSTGITVLSSEYLLDTLGANDLEPGEYLFIEISDTGKGMDPATVSRIFDPFFTTKFTGRGLGLAAALGIAKSHGGAIKVYSEPGKGSSFKIFFPPCNTEIETFSPDKEPDAFYGEGTVLIIDDEEWVRIVAGNVLQKFGYKIVTAKNGLEGLKLYAPDIKNIKLVILDMMMPVMDGKDTFRELKRLEPDIKVLLTSGYAENKALSRFQGKGLSGFIQKPFSPIDLMKKVTEILKNTTI